MTEPQAQDDGMVIDPQAERRGIGIVLLAVAAMAIGLVGIFSTSATRPFVEAGRVDWRHPLLMQSLYAIVSLTAILVVARVRYRDYRRFAPWALLAVTVLLALLLVPGVAREINGAKRWFRIGPIGIQPSEFAKVALILFFAWFLSRKEDPLAKFWTGFLPCFVILGCVVGLVALEPDFGTSLFIAAVGGFLMLLAGARLFHIVPAAVICGVFFASFMYERFEHIPGRIEAFLDDPMANYNTEHSLLALGCGGLTGAGLGNGREKLAYLPESSCDFIFSILGEELGFIGATVVVLLYVVFLWKGASIALRARDTFGLYLAAGATLLVALQAMIHIAVATASIPTKGIPLPFISLGGSNLLSLSIGVGILASVARWREQPQAGLG